jgi:HK97 family phage prohead protease
MSNKKLEARSLNSELIELRNTDNQKYVDGFGILYNQEAELWEGYFEQIDKNAFTESLAKNEEVKSFFNHDPNFVLSTTRSNTALSLQNGNDGLFFSSPIHDTSYGKDLIENLSRGNVKGASFTFVVTEDEVTVDNEGNYHRTILKGDLYEVGPVTNPAYVLTSVSLCDKDSLLKEAQKRTQDTKFFVKEVEANEFDFYKTILSYMEIANNN